MAHISDETAVALAKYGEMFCNHPAISEGKINNACYFILRPTDMQIEFTSWACIDGDSHAYYVYCPFVRYANPTPADVEREYNKAIAAIYDYLANWDERVAAYRKKIEKEDE